MSEFGCNYNVVNFISFSAFRCIIDKQCELQVQLTLPIVYSYIILIICISYHMIVPTSFIQTIIIFSIITIKIRCITSK